MNNFNKNKETDSKNRIAIVNADKCKPKKCRQECKRSCPVVKMGNFHNTFKYFNAIHPVFFARQTVYNC
jgi:ribosome biogenesis protein Tsr3